jgi:hypothetical protein
MGYFLNLQIAWVLESLILGPGENKKDTEM